MQENLRQGEVKEVMIATSSHDSVSILFHTSFTMVLKNFRGEVIW